MQDPKTQNKLLTKAVEHAQALRSAINMELGSRNQLHVSNSQSRQQINAIVPQRQFGNSNQSQIFQTQSTSTLSKFWSHLVNKP